MTMTMTTSIDIPAGQAPAVRIGYGFNSALFHQLIRQVRLFRLGGKVERPAWQPAIRGVAELYLPLGPLNWLEYAVTGDDVVGLKAALAARARYLSDELGQALVSIADDYRQSDWPRHRIELEQALTGTGDLISPIKDSLLTTLAHALTLNLGTEPFEITLVPQCHEPTGAYSHPTIIDIGRFEGWSLVEVAVHEIGHVAAARSASDPGSELTRMISGGIAARATSARVLEAIHLLLFHAAATLVRRHANDDYRSVASRLGAYTKLGVRLGRPSLSEADVDVIWTRLEQGESRLDDVIAQLMFDTQ